MRQFRKVLVATDLTPITEEAFRCARTICTSYNAALSVLHVVDIPGAAEKSPGVLTSQAELENSGSRALNIMQEMIEENAGDIPDVTAHVANGVPYKEIIRFAKEDGADLIVLATHGRKGIARTFLGSVAEKLVRNSPVPVMTVKAGGEIAREGNQRFHKHELS